MSWKRQIDDIYLFRDNRWYRDDELEVPNARLKQWIRAWADVNSIYKQPLDRTAQIPADYAVRVLDLWSEMVGNLTLWQLNNGLKYTVTGDGAQKTISAEFEIKTIMGEAMPVLQLPFGNLADLLMDDRNVLRFYAGLSQEDRAALLAGKLACDALSPADQKMAAYLQPRLPFGLPTPQPISLGLVSPIAEGHVYVDGGQAASSWPNRTNISYVILDITSPQRFPQSQTRSVR
jgi:hypothetical protein